LCHDVQEMNQLPNDLFEFICLTADDHSEVNRLAFVWVPCVSTRAPQWQHSILVRAYPPLFCLIHHSYLFEVDKIVQTAANFTMLDPDVPLRNTTT